MAPVLPFEVVAILLVWQSLLFAALSGGLYLNTKHYPKKFIAWYMFANAIYFTLIWLHSFGHYQLLRFFFPLGMPLLISFLPLFYFYFRALTQPKFKVTGSQYIHLVPSAICFITQFIFFLLPEDDSLRFLAGIKISSENRWIEQVLIWSNRFFFYIFFTLQFIYYFFKFRTNLRLHRLRLELMFSYKEKLDLKWMQYLFIGILLFFLGNDLAYFIRNNHPWFAVVFFCLGMLVINFFIGYHSMMQNDLAEHEMISRMTHFYGQQQETANAGIEQQELFSTQEFQKYQRSGLKDDTRQQILQQLELLMEQEQFYKDSQISIEDLAIKLNMSSKNVSQAINEGYQKNFFNYINELRIAEARDLLQSEAHRNLSIEGIAREVGFQSKSSFYTAFKKSTGFTPTEFRSHPDNNS